MNETPDDPWRPDEDRRGQKHDPAVPDPLGGQRPPPDEPDEDEEDEDEYPAPSRRGILSGARLAVAGVAVVVLLGGGAALALNGGGGGGDAGDAASSADDGRSSEEDAAFEFAQCVRDNGIEDFPDPQVGAEGGISFGGFGADQADSEEFNAAREACEHILEDAVPEGEARLTPEERAELQDQWRAVAQCVRDQGYGMPDPEVDEYGRVKMRAEGDGVEQAIEECGSEIGLGEPGGGEGGSSDGGEGGS